MFCDCNGEDTAVGVPRMMDWESPCEAITDGRSSELMELLMQSMVARLKEPPCEGS